MSLILVVISIFMNITGQIATVPEKNPANADISAKDNIVKLRQEQIRILDDTTIHSWPAEFNNVIPDQLPYQQHATANPVYRAEIQLNNRSHDTLNRLLMVDYPLAETIHLYHPNTGIIQQTGNAIPIQQHSVASPDMLFSVQLHPGMNNLFIQMESPVSKFPVKLFTVSAYEQEKNINHLYYAVVSGFILIVLLLNSYFYWLTKDVLHLYYLLYIALAVITFIVYTGLAHQYIWPEFTAWNRHAFYVFQNLMIAAHIIFASELLMLRVFKRRMHNILMGTAVVFSMAAVISLMLPSSVSYRIISWLCMMLFPLALLAGYYPIRQKYKPAFFFMAVCVMFTFSVITSYARSLQDTSEPEGTCRSIAFALSVEIMMLSIAMGFRTKDKLQPIQNLERTVLPLSAIAEQDEYHDPETLSQKEKLVIRYLESGLTDQEIADVLNISINTVKTHLRNIYQKLDVRNRTEAILKVRYTEYI